MGSPQILYDAGEDVFRVPYLDVLAVTKTPTWVRGEPASEEFASEELQL